MSTLVRATLMFFSFILAIFSLVIMLCLLNTSLMLSLITALGNLADNNKMRFIIIIVFLVLFAGSVLTLVISILTNRLRKARIRDNEIGQIDIGVDAIESIALNSAKSAQAGIKEAKARVMPTKDDKLIIQLSAMVYSDVEIPAMMTKVQERVQKDVERYTGIQIASVEIKVSRVEAIAARVEH